MGKFQFAGDLQGRGERPICRYGTKDSGITSEVGGWHGMIRTRVWHDRVKEQDRFAVWVIPHWQDSGPPKLIAEGVLDHSIEEPFIVPAVFA